MAKRLKAIYQVEHLDQSRLVDSLRQQGFRVEPAPHGNRGYIIYQGERDIGIIDGYDRAQVRADRSPALDEFFTNYTE